MSGRQHASAERRRNHRAGQQRIRHYCSCGRAVSGNPGWASHQRANPDHNSVTYTTFMGMADSQDARGDEAGEC